MEHTSELVKLGNLMHSETYKLEKKNELVDSTICIDFIRGKDHIELHEIKKSQKMEEAHLFQLLYYLYYLKRKGVKATGFIDYPKLRKREKVELTQQSEEKLIEVLKEIRHIVNGPIPRPIYKRYCRKCSYFNLCWSD